MLCLANSNCRQEFQSGDGKLLDRCYPCLRATKFGEDATPTRLTSRQLQHRHSGKHHRTCNELDLIEASVLHPVSNPPVKGSSQSVLVSFISRQISLMSKMSLSSMTFHLSCIVQLIPDIGHRMVFVLCLRLLGHFLDATSAHSH